MQPCKPVNKKALAIIIVILMLVVALPAGHALLDNRSRSEDQNGAHRVKTFTEEELYEDWAPIIPGMYDPSDEACYYKPGGEVVQDPETGTEYKTNSWSSRMVYLHDVTKDGLLDLVGKHLENLEQALVNLGNKGGDNPWGVGSEWYTITERQVEGLRALKNELDTIEGTDTERLQTAYDRFHEILLVHEQEK